MGTKEPKNEELICKAVMRMMARRRGEAIIGAEPVDAVVRDKPAVEWVFDTKSAKFAIEHTRIESFPEQIADGKLFGQLLGPLEIELAGRVPGEFWLVADVGAAKAPSTEHGRIRSLLAEWILAEGAGLEPEMQAGSDAKCALTAKPTGVPFEVTLRRQTNYDSVLFVMQSVSGDPEGLQRERIRTALARKCPKLLEACKGGRGAILVLESNDIALANLPAIATATIAELVVRDDSPDIVIWARTSTRPWKAWFLREGDKMYPTVPMGGPHVLDPGE